MSYILVIKTIDSSEREIELDASSKEEALCLANEYTKGGEGIVEYAYLYDGITSLEYSYSTCYFQDEEDM